MPIYEYVCQMCQKKFEVLIRRSEDEEKLNCPECHNTSVKRKFSTFGFKSGNTFSSSGGSGCGECSSHNCGSCGHHH